MSFLFVPNVYKDTYMYGYLLREIFSVKIFVLKDYIYMNT